MPACSFASATIHGALLGSLAVAAFPGSNAPALCEYSQYQVSMMVLDCNGGVGSMSAALETAKPLSIGSFPKGARDLEIAVSADVDFDMQLIDSLLGRCITGFNCQHDKGCAQESDYCISYERMPVYFSGDDKKAPVQEKIKIKGVLTREMSITVFAQASGTATVTYSYSALPFCPDPLPGCVRCHDYMGCNDGYPVCDGTQNIVCSATRPTARPNFQHGVHLITKNVSAGFAEVGGIIRHKIDNTVSNIDTTVKTIENNVRDGIDDLSNKVTNELAKAKGSVTNMTRKANQTLEQISRDIHAGLSTLAPGAFPTFPPAKSPDWFLSKEEATNGMPGSRSQVPIALGPWILSFFSSWTSPGWLCTFGLLIMAFFFLSATSFRCCKLGRAYGHVLPRPAPRGQSRDVFAFREELVLEELEDATPAPSRVQLLQPELEPLDVE